MKTKTRNVQQKGFVKTIGDSIETAEDNKNTNGNSYQRLIPRLKPKSVLLSKRCTTVKSPNKLKNSQKKLDARIMMVMNPRSISNQASFDIRKRLRTMV